MKIQVEITRRSGLRDPEGATTARALRDLGFDSVSDVHFGRSIVVEVEGDDRDQALIDVEDMCRKLLANPVLEDFTIEVLD